VRGWGNYGTMSGCKSIFPAKRAAVRRYGWGESGGAAKIFMLCGCSVWSGNRCGGGAGSFGDDATTDWPFHRIVCRRDFRGGKFAYPRQAAGSPRSIVVNRGQSCLIVPDRA
jgi:hypothetical protein